ncbi:MAG: hypothetical protein ACO1QB_04495 [Verrucomicrobiales bacterium]
MNFFAPMLAQVTLGAPEPTKVARLALSDPLLIIGVAALIFAALIFYVAVIRGPKQQSRTRRVYKSGHENDDASSESSSKKRKKRKSRRREHRGRNPTLAQTGGLPPPTQPSKEAEFFG